MIDLNDYQEGDGDGYGRYWDYRVFSEIWTEPDVPGSGKRYLTVHQVTYQGWVRAYPMPAGDVIDIESKPASPDGIGIEEALLDAERIMQAFNKPVMIRAEWERYFKHSEEQHVKHEAKRRMRHA